MRTSRTARLGGLASALVLLVSGCAVAESVTGSDASGGGTSTAPDGSVAVDGSPVADDFTPIYSDAGTINDDLEWRGGMITGATSSSGEGTSVTGWVPGLDQIASCNLKLLADDEDLEGAPTVMATTKPGAPTVVVLYGAKQRAAGLDAEKTRVLFRTVDLAACTAGDPTVLVDGVHEDLSLDLTFLGAGDDVVAVAPYSTIAGELPDVPVVLGINPAAREVVWSKSFPGKSISHSSRTYGAFDLEVDIPFDYTTPPVRGLYSPATGEQIAAGADFEPPTGDLGGGRLLATMRPHRDESSFRVALVGEGSPRDVTGAMSRDSVVTDDGRGGRVMVGFFCAADDEECSVDGDGRALGFAGADGSVHEILPATKVHDLELELLGASNGIIYVRTTAEDLSLGLDGQQVGEPRTTPYPYLPVAEQRDGDTLWTLWQHAEGPGLGRYSITKNGRHLPGES